MQQMNDAGVVSEAVARRAMEEVLPRVAADDAVLHLRHNRESTTRFSNNAIAQGIFRDRLTTTLTVAFGNKIGTASVDSIEAEDLHALVRRAEEVARLAPPDPEFVPSLGPQQYADVHGYFGSTADLTEEGAAGIVRRIVGAAARASMKASGTVETSAWAEAVATKNGLFAWYPGTLAEVGCTLTAPDSTGWARDACADLDRLDPERLAETAIDTARRSAKPGPVEPGRHTAVLLPAATARLGAQLVYSANARLTLEGLTFLSGIEDRKLAGNGITIYSDPLQPEVPMTPFDEEGVPRRRTLWVDRGEFKGMWWDRWTAQRNGTDPVPLPESLCMEGTGRSLDDLISGVERGILVTHFWYVRSVKADQTLVTGLTRDGTFWIEDGKIVRPVKNLRFNDTCIGMLQRAVDIGRPERCTGPETFPSVFPPIVVRDWNFVGVTEF